MYAVWPRRQHFSNLDEEEIQPLAAKVKGHQWIHTRRSCPRWNINPLSPTQGAPHHWQPLQSADGFPGRGLPVPVRKVRLPSWPEAPPVVPDTEAQPLITAKPTAEGEAPRADTINFSSAALTLGFNSRRGALRLAGLEHYLKSALMDFYLWVYLVRLAASRLVALCFDWRIDWRGYLCFVSPQAVPIVFLFLPVLVSVNLPHIISLCYMVLSVNGWRKNPQSGAADRSY